MGTNRHTILLYFRQIKKHPISFLIALIFIPAGVILLDTFLPYFLSLAIGAIASSSKADVSSYLVFAALVGIGGIIANIIGFQMLVRHESNVRTRIYESTFNALLKKDFSFYVNEKIGALTSRFIDFGRAHITLQDLLIIRTLGFVLSLITSLVIVALHVPILALALGIIIVGVFTHIRISSKIRKPYRIERKRLIAEIHGRIADGLTNNLIVKTFAGERSEEKFLRKELDQLDHVYVKDFSLFGYDGAIRNFIMASAQVVGIAACAYFVFNGSLDIAIAIFALTYLQRTSGQIFQLGEIVNGYEQALLEAAPMSDILAIQSQINDADDAKTMRSIQPTIEFEHVTYRYADKKINVLDDVNLSIPAGQKVGLVGSSGAGKTTITNLLLRFYDVTDGVIRIGGHDIRGVTQESLRKHIAYVPQEPLLFHRSLRDNIAYGKKGATDEDIRRAATQANAWEFITKLPDGLDTLVGERGVKLSGGQRQRIAIARALLKDAPILILDEATSALDSESEKLIQDALEKLMIGRTSIVIAHRLSTIAKLDRVIVLDNGKILEDGTHSQLLDKKGVYANLWNHQSGGFINE